MLATPFDFDVISGPSLPRDDRTPVPDAARPQEPESSAPPTPPQSR